MSMGTISSSPTTDSCSLDLEDWGLMLLHLDPWPTAAKEFHSLWLQSVHVIVQVWPLLPPFVALGVPSLGGMVPTVLMCLTHMLLYPSVLSPIKCIVFHFRSLSPLCRPFSCPGLTSPFSPRVGCVHQTKAIGIPMGNI